MEASVQLIRTDQGDGSYQDRKLDSNSSQDQQHPMDLSDKGRVKTTAGRDVGGSRDRVVEVPVHGGDAVSRFTEEGHVLSDAVRCETEMLKSVMVEISSAPSVATPSKEDTDKNRDIDTVHEGDMIFTAVPDSALSVSDSTLPLETDDGDSAGITVVETVEVEISDAAEEEMVVPDILEVRVDSDEVEVPVSETVEMEMAVTETVETGVIEECVPMADIEEDVETTPMETETDVEMAPLEMTSTDLRRDETAPTETLPLDLHVQKAPTDLHGNNRTPMQTIPMDLHVERTCAKTTYADPHGGETTPSDSTRVHLHVERTATERTPAYFREDETTPSESAPMDLHVGKSSMEVPPTDVHGDKLPAEPAPIDLHVERTPVETPDLHDRALIQTAPMDLHVERPSSTLHKAGMDTAEDYSIMTAPPAEMDDTYVVNSEKDVGRDQTNSQVTSPHRANDDTKDSTTKTEKSKNYRMDVVVVADQSHNVRGVEEGRQQGPPRTHPPAEGVEEIGHDPNAHASHTVRVGKTDSAEGFEEVDVESVEAEEQAKTETMNISRTETNPVDSSEEVDVEICEEEAVEVCEEVEVEKKESADVSRRETKAKDISEEADVEICEDEEEKEEESIKRAQGQTIAEDISEEIDIEICEDEEEKKELASLPQQETSTANTPDKMSATVSQGESYPADSLEEIDVETYEEEVEEMTESGDVSQRKTSPADISEEVDIEACEDDMDKKKESAKVSPPDSCGQVDRETFVNEEKVNRESAVNVSQGQTNQNPAEEEVDTETCGNEMEEKKETAKNPENETSPPDGSGKVEDGSEKVEDGSEKVEDGSEKVEVQTCVDQKMRGFSGLDVSQEEVHPADVEVDVKTCDNENKEKKESGYIPQEQTTSADISEDVDIETCEDEDDVKSENIPQDKHRSDKVSLPPITSAELADTGRPDDALTPEDVPVTRAQEVAVRESNSVSQAGYQQPLEEIPNTSAGEGAEEGPSPLVSQIADPQPAEELSSTSVTTRGEGTHDPADDMRKQGSTQLSGEVRRITSSEASMEDRAPGSPEHDSSLHLQKEEGASLEADSEFSDAKTTSLDKVCRAEGGEDIPVGENLQQSKDISHTNINTEEEADCPVEVSEEGDIKRLQADSEPTTTKPEERPENPADFQAAADAQLSDGISSVQTARLENGSIAANAISEGGGKPIPEDVSISHSRDEIEKHPVEASPPTGPQKSEEAFSSSVIHTEEKETEDSVTTPVSNTKEKETEDEDGIVTPITVTEESTENEPECVSKTADTHGLATKAEESTENEPECVSKTADTHGLATKAEESTENEPECVSKTADTHGLATKAEENTENEPECVSKTADTHGLDTKAEENTENEPECVSKTADTHGLATKAEESTENEPECVSKTADTHGLATKAEENTENELVDVVSETADLQIGGDSVCASVPDTEEGMASTEVVSETTDTQRPGEIASVSVMNSEENLEQELDVVLETANTQSHRDVSSMSVMKSEENREQELDVVSETANTQSHRDVSSMSVMKSEENREQELDVVSETANTQSHRAVSVSVVNIEGNMEQDVSETANTHGDVSDVSVMNSEENTEQEVDVVSVSASASAPSPTELSASLTSNREECVVDEQVDVVSVTRDTQIMEDHSELTSAAKDNKDAEPEEAILKSTHTQPSEDKLNVPSTNTDECVENELVVSETSDPQIMEDFSKLPNTSESEPVEAVSETTHTQPSEDKSRVVDAREECVEDISVTRDSQISRDNAELTTTRDPRESEPVEAVPETTCTQLSEDKSRVVDDAREECVEDVSVTRDSQISRDNAELTTTRDPRESEPVEVFETAHSHSQLSGDTSSATPVTEERVENDPVNVDLVTRDTQISEDKSKSRTSTVDHVESGLMDHISVTADKQSPEDKSNAQTTNREDCMGNEPTDVALVTADTQISEDVSRLPATTTENEPVDVTSDKAELTENVSNAPTSSTVRCVDNEAADSMAKTAVEKTFEGTHGTTSAEPCVENESVDVRSETVSPSTIDISSALDTRVVEDEECGVDVTDTKNQDISENMSNTHVNNNNIDMEASQVDVTSDAVEIEHMEERIPKDAETDFPKTSDAGEIEHMEERIPKDAETDFPKAATSSESSNPETATEAVKDGSTLEESEFRASADLTDTHEVSTIQEDSGVDVDSNPSDSKSELHTVFVDSSGQETVETSLAAISPTVSDEKNNEGDVESSVFKMQTYASSNALSGSTEDISPVTVGQINSMISRPEKESTDSSGREASPILHSEGVAAPEELGTVHEVKTDDRGEENDKKIHMQETRPEKEKIQAEKDDRNEIVVKDKGTVDISVNDTPVNHGGEENDDIILNAKREDSASPKPEKSEVFVLQNEETAGKKQAADSKCTNKDVQVDKSNKAGTVSCRPAEHKRVDNIFEKFTPLRQRHLEPVVYLGRRADDKTVDRKTSHADSCSGRTLPQPQVDLREEDKDEEKSDVYSSDSSSEDEGDADDHTDKVVEEDDRDDEAPKSRRHERDQLSMPPDTDEKAKDTQQFKNTENASIKSDKTGNKGISTLDDEDSDDVDDEDSDDVDDTQLTGGDDKTVQPSQNTEASSAKKDLAASLSNSTAQQGESLEDGRSFEKDEHAKNPLLGSAKHDNNSVPDKGDDITNLDLSDNDSFSSDGGEEDDIIEDDAEDSKSRNEDKTKINPDMSVFDIKNRQTPNTEDKTESNVENNSNGAAGKDVRKLDSGDDLNKKPSTSESDLDKSESDNDFAEDPSTPQFQFSRSKTLKTYTRKSVPAGVEQERMARPEITARPILHMKTYSRKSEPALADPIDSDSSDSDDMEMSRNSERNFRNSRRWENGDGGQDFPEHQWKVETVRLGEDSTKTKPSIVSRITKALTSASRDLSRGRMLTSVPFDSRKEGTLTSDESKTVALVPASRKRRRGRTTWSIRLKKRRSSRPEKVDSKGEGESVENEFELAHKCITCNTAFPTPGRLRKHQMQHEAGRHFYCDVSWFSPIG